LTKKVFISCFLVVSTFQLFAQVDEDSYVLGDSKSTNPKPQNKGFDWDRVTIGGGLGLTFGTVTYVEIAPNVGYYLTDNFLAGVGVNYTYYEYKSLNFHTSIYGARIYGEYFLKALPLMAHAETEVINLESDINRRINIVNIYVGGGLKQEISKRSYFFILALWNLNETKASTYFLQPNPIIRGGIAIGI